MKMLFIKGCENIKKINISKNKIKIITIASIALLLIISGYCLAKYEETKILFTDTEIAMPVLEVEGKETTKINAINNVGYYDFVVKNYNENNISDVPQNYSIEIITKAENSVNFEIYKDDEIIPLIENKTDSIYIAGKEQKTDNYRLIIAYDKNDIQENIQEDVQIKVHSEQSNI